MASGDTRFHGDNLAYRTGVGGRVDAIHLENDEKE